MGRNEERSDDVRPKPSRLTDQDLGQCFAQVTVNEHMAASCAARQRLGRAFLLQIVKGERKTVQNSPQNAEKPTEHRKGPTEPKSGGRPADFWRSIRSDSGGERKRYAWQHG